MSLATKTTISLDPFSFIHLSTTKHTQAMTSKRTNTLLRRTIIYTPRQMFMMEFSYFMSSLSAHSHEEGAYLYVLEAKILFILLQGKSPPFFCTRIILTWDTYYVNYILKRTKNSFMHSWLSILIFLNVPDKLCTKEATALPRKTLMSHRKGSDSSLEVLVSSSRRPHL